jgi:hypothetical protein
MTIIWNDTEIGGHKCASVTIDDKRLYVAERFGRIDFDDEFSDKPGIMKLAPAETKTLKCRIGIG